MSLLEFFRPQKKTSASLAKERLQIIVLNAAAKMTLRLRTYLSLKKTF